MADNSGERLHKKVKIEVRDADVRHHDESGEKIDRQAAQQQENQSANSSSSVRPANATRINRDDESCDTHYRVAAGKKCCTISKHKDQITVEIREVCEKNGQCIPGRKGISLTLEQYHTLKNFIKAGTIDEEIKKLETT